MSRRRFIPPPSPGTVLGSLALIVALGGTGYAATGEGAGEQATATSGERSTVASSAPASASDRQATAAQRPKRRKRRARRGPRGRQGQAGARGPQGPAGAPGSAVAYAQVNSNGSLVAANSKNVSATSALAAVPNYYCITATVAVKNVVASRQASAGEISATLGDPLTSCPAGTTATVQTYSSAGANAQAGFSVVFN